jgi:hypothetical protein
MITTLKKSDGHLSESFYQKISPNDLLLLDSCSINQMHDCGVGHFIRDPIRAL